MGASAQYPLSRNSMFLSFSVVFLAYALTSLCRRLLYVFALDVGKEIAYTKEDLGNLVSTQAVCVTFSKTLFSILSDKTSSVKLIFIGLVGVGSSLLGLAVAQSFSHLFLSTILNGLLQGSIWTPSVVLIKKWSPDANFGTWYSIFGISNTVSGMLLPTAATYYWRLVVWTCGSACICLAVTVLLVLQQDNRSPEPVVMKEKGDSKEEEAVGTKQVLTALAIWHCGSMYAFPHSIRIVCETWFPLHLAERGFSAAGFQFFLEAGGFVGVLLSGRLVDVLTLRWGIETSLRRCTYGSTLLMLLVTALTCLVIEDVPSVAGFLCGACYLGCMNIWGLCNARIAPTHLQGTASAVISLLSTGGAVLAGAPLSWLMGSSGVSSLSSLFLSLSLLVVMVYALRLDVQMKEVKEEGEKKKEE